MTKEKKTINTRISYINVDSRHRNKTQINIYDGQLFNLPPYPLKFIHNSSIISVNLPDHPFLIGDQIVLENIISKNIILQNIISIKKNSRFLKIFHENHGLSFYGLYNSNNIEDFIPIDYVDNLPNIFSEDNNIPDNINKYFILKKNYDIDLTIQISNIKGNDSTRTYIGNIPINFINGKHKVFLIFIKKINTFVLDNDNYLIMLDKKASINYKDHVNFINDIYGNKTTMLSENTIYIKFYNLFGIPLNYLNTGVGQKNMYFTIINVNKNDFTIDVNYPAIVDPIINFYNNTDLFNESDINYFETNIGGGTTCCVRKIKEIIQGYPNPNRYQFQLDRTYNKIIQIRLVGSIFPNSQKIINNNNNKLYWRNLDDGDWIYQLSIKPGNYSPQKLEKAISDAFSKIIRYQYTKEYTKNIFPKIITDTTIADNTIYDIKGNNKYHIVDVSISTHTDIVSFKSYKEIVQTNYFHDDLTNFMKNWKNIINDLIIYIPDNFIEIIMAEKIFIDFGINGIRLVPHFISPFNDKNDILFIYLTPNSHQRIINIYPYVYGNLYKYIGHDSILSNGFYKFSMILENKRAILINFYRQKKIYPIKESYYEINSINTQTILLNFQYDYYNNNVYLWNHNLNIGDLIITDQFVDQDNINILFVYEIINIIDKDNFNIVRIEHGQKYKFIYDSILINFSYNKKDCNKYGYNIPNDINFDDCEVCWLDQILPKTDISILSDFPLNNNTLSIIKIIPTIRFNELISYQNIRIRHDNHKLIVGQKIIIDKSLSINRVPYNMINKTHIINKIIDDNHYEILLDKFTPLINPIPYHIPNIVSIKYPNIFQIFFNFQDTLGDILAFNNVGHDNSITIYKHIIKNTYPYINDNNKLYNNKIKMVGDDYFYIVCPELATYTNTKPVGNVFAKLRWYDNPGTIIYDSFVPTITKYKTSLRTLSKLNISIINPNGELVDFNGLDHSFVIEIIEKID